MEKQSYKLIAKTQAGLEGVLTQELKALGAENVEAQRRAVSFDGNTQMLYQANLWCRTALSILKPLFEFSFQTQQEFYEIMREFNWDKIFSVNKTIAINALAFESVFTNTHFLSQRSKDAIADFFTEKTGKRPNVNIDDPQIKINVFINKDKCSVSLDSSGAPLFKRGYRRKNVAAPLNEVLGAGLILLTGWDKKKPFYDPMCGSGTFSIEAGMMALNMAPSIFRRNFSFMHWNDYEPILWDQLRQKARDSELKDTPEIIAADISNQSMDAARQNMMEAGLLGRIKLEKRDFFQTKPSHENGILIINPPYGRRLESDDISEYYQKLGTTLKHNFTGFEAWILSPDKLLTHKIGLRHSSQQVVFNGQIECRFLGYELFKGSKKEFKTEPKSDTFRKHTKKEGEYKKKQYRSEKNDSFTPRPPKKYTPRRKNDK